MKKFKSKVALIGISISAMVLITLWAAINTYYINRIKIIPHLVYEPDKSMASKIESIRKIKDPSKPLYEVYKDIPLIDVHNHGARYVSAYTWDKYGVDKVVLFGNVSEPSAQRSDGEAWLQYTNEPSKIYPSFAGISVYEDVGVQYTKEKLEKGYLNIGEIYAASSYSPVGNKLLWKARTPLAGKLPEIYELSAQYKVPMLLHIDPPNGTQINILKQAMNEHPNTIFIFGHANVYNSPENIENLLKEHDNLYIDFFAGFTKYNPGSSNKIEDFIPLIEKYPDRFFLGTDSGYEIGYENALSALYDVVDLLTPSTAVKVAYQNYERIIEQQPLTKTQEVKIKKLLRDLGEKGTYALNKRMANELIFELEKKSAAKSKK